MKSVGEFDEKYDTLVELGIKKATELGHMSVGTEHVLLALLDDLDNPVYRLLQNVHGDVAQIRATMETYITQIVRPRKINPNELHKVGEYLRTRVRRSTRYYYERDEEPHLDISVLFLLGNFMENSIVQSVLVGYCGIDPNEIIMQVKKDRYKYSSK